MICYLDCIQYTFVRFKMNKTTLLVTGLIAGLGVAFSYGYLNSDVEAVTSQEQLTVDAFQAKEQSVSSGHEDKAVAIARNSSTEQQTTSVDESSYVRTAPPPPISSNKTKDGRYTTPQAHGHEEQHDNDEKNAPPPPRGAN